MSNLSRRGRRRREAEGSEAEAAQAGAATQGRGAGEGAKPAGTATDDEPSADAQTCRGPAMSAPSATQVAIPPPGSGTIVDPAACHASGRHPPPTSNLGALHLAGPQADHHPRRSVEMQEALKQEKKARRRSVSSFPRSVVTSCARGPSGSMGGSRMSSAALPSPRARVRQKLSACADGQPADAKVRLVSFAITADVLPRCGQPEAAPTLIRPLNGGRFFVTNPR